MLSMAVSRKLYPAPHKIQYTNYNSTTPNTVSKNFYLAARKIRHQEASTKAALWVSIALCAASLAAIFSLSTLE